MEKETNTAKFRAALVRAYSELFANSVDYAYSASKTTPEGLADKILAAFLKNGGNKDGKGVELACRECQIAHTYRAISEFLDVAPVAAEKAVKPALRRVCVIGLSNIHAAMTGVSRINRAHDLVTLEYTDGTRETGKVNAAKWGTMQDEVFKIISFVQAQRKPVAT